jgi:predicted phage-related endonuclease
LKQGNDKVQKSLFIFKPNVFNELNFSLLPPHQGYTKAPPAMLSQIPHPLLEKRESNSTQSSTKNLPTQDAKQLKKKKQAKSRIKARIGFQKSLSI